MQDLETIDPDCQTLTDLSSLHVPQHPGSMRERGLRPCSIRTRWRVITAWLNRCVVWGLMGSSPATRIKAAKVTKTRKPFLTEEQFASLLELCPLDLPPWLYHPPARPTIPRFAQSPNIDSGSLSGGQGLA